VLQSDVQGFAGLGECGSLEVVGGQQQRVLHREALQDQGDGIECCG
jgi:hypothetical protein